MSNKTYESESPYEQNNIEKQIELDTLKKKYDIAMKFIHWISIEGCDLVDDECRACKALDISRELEKTQ